MALPPITGRTTPPPPANPAPDGARSAAQRAFFDAALVKANAPASAAVTTPARTEARAVQPAVTRLRDETTIPPHPGRLLRPGSLIDIKV